MLGYYQLSVTQDFVLYTFIVYLTVYEATRTCTSKLKIVPEARTTPFDMVVIDSKKAPLSPNKFDLPKREIGTNLSGLVQMETPALVMDEDGTIPVVVVGPTGPKLKKLVLLD